MKPENILEIKNLKVKFGNSVGLFRKKIAEVKAVDGVNVDSKKAKR